MRILLLLFIPFILLSCSSELSEKEMSENQLQLPSAGLHFNLYKRNAFEMPSTKGQVFITLNDVVRNRAEVAITNGSKEIYYKIIKTWTENRFELNGKWYQLQCNYIANRLIKRDKCSFTITLCEPLSDLESL